MKHLDKFINWPIFEVIEDLRPNWRSGYVSKLSGDAEEASLVHAILAFPSPRFGDEILLQICILGLTG